MAQYPVSTLTRRTVAGLPHVATGAARGVGARRPFAGTVLCDGVALAHALQRVHLAHAQQHRPCGREGGGAETQRRSGEKDREREGTEREGREREMEVEADQTGDQLRN